VNSEAAKSRFAVPLEEMCVELQKGGAKVPPPKSTSTSRWKIKQAETQRPAIRRASVVLKQLRLDRLRLQKLDPTARGSRPAASGRTAIADSLRRPLDELREGPLKAGTRELGRSSGATETRWCNYLIRAREASAEKPNRIKAARPTKRDWQFDSGLFPFRGKAGNGKL